MLSNPFANTKLVNLPLGQPVSGGSLVVPVVGQGYNPVIFGFFNNQSRTTGLATGSGSLFPTLTWDQNIIDIAANNPPVGFQTALVTFSASQAGQYLNPDGSPKSGYDVRRFCSCGNCLGVSTPGGSTGHTWTYIVYYNPGSIPDPPTSPPTTLIDKCRFDCENEIIKLPVPETPSINLGISQFQSNDTIYTYFDIAMEVRGNTYCAAGTDINTKYRWFPQPYPIPAPPATPPFNQRPFFWVLDNKFGGWADGITPSPIAFPSYPVVNSILPHERTIKPNNDGWLVEKMAVNTPPPPTLGGSVYDKLDGSGGVNKTVCREGCKHIYYEPVPLPDDLPESQKFRIIDDYFEAYQTVFVRMFQPAFTGTTYRNTIDWTKGNINTKGQKLMRANKKFAEFLARYYAPINKTATPSTGPSGVLPNTYRYTPLQTGFFLDFSTCDGYVGEYWNGQTNPFGLSPPNLPRTIYFRNGTTVEIEGGVSIFDSSVRIAFVEEHNTRKFGVVLLDVNEVAFSYVLKRTFRYKVKIPIQEMGDGFTFELKPKLANFWTDQDGEITESFTFPDDGEVLTMVFDPNAQTVIDDRGGKSPGPPYLQSNFTFPACYHIHQTPVVLPTPVNNSVRVFDYPNDKSVTTDLIDTIVQSSLDPPPPGYTLIDIDLTNNLATYQKITTVPTNQEVQVVKHPGSPYPTDFGVFKDTP